MIKKISNLGFSFLKKINQSNYQRNIDKLFRFEKDIFSKNTPEIKTFSINHFGFSSWIPQKLKVTQNVNDKAVLYKKIYDLKSGKIKKIPFEAGIAKSKNKWMTTYHFLEPETNKEIGFVTICDWQQAKKYPQFVTLYLSEWKLLKNYSELGVKGKRITIDYLQNNNSGIYSGIGRAADQIAVEYCLKIGIKPMITSIADFNSHAAHYLRGRRFFYDKNFEMRFGISDPNILIKQRIKNTPKGQKVNCRDLGELNMYMPQKVIKKYLNKIKKHPILH